MNWIRNHPVRAVSKTVITLMLAVLGGYLGFQLAQPPMFVVGPIAQGLFTILGAALPCTIGMLLMWLEVRGRLSLAARIRRVLLLAVAALGVVFGVIAGYQAYLYGMVPPIGTDYLATYDRLWSALDRAYPYFEQKELDRDELYSHYRTFVAEAEKPETFHRVVGEMLLSFHDTHTGLLQPPKEARCCFALTREIEGRAIVTTAGPIAEAAGLARGDEILEINGLPLEQALDRVPARLRNGSTPWLERYHSFNYLLSTAQPDDSLVVTFQDEAGADHEVTLSWPVEGSTSQTTGNPAPLITGERLASGVGLIRIPTLSAGPNHDLVAEFDAALDPLMDSPGLILDLRGSNGGSSELGGAMAGRFLDEPIMFGYELYPARLAIRGFIGKAEHVVSPRADHYSGPLVLLLDEQVVSSSEWLAVALIDSGRASSVGRRTAGASGNPLTFKLGNGALLRYSTADFRRMDGSSLEGVGLEPSVAVQWTLDDIRQGRDPDVEQAQLLISRALSTCDFDCGKAALNIALP